MKKSTVRRDAVIEALRDVVGCFVKREDYWWFHKDNNGEWVEVSEDLRAFLDDAADLLDDTFGDN